MYTNYSGMRLHNSHVYCHLTFIKSQNLVQACITGPKPFYGTTAKRSLQIRS